MGFTQDDPDSLWTFTKIVEVDSTSKLELFARANEWFTKNSYSKTSKSYVNENATGKLVSDVIVSFDRDAGASYCKVSFIAKDNKYKIEISKFFNVTWGSLKQRKSDKYMGFYAPQKKWERLKAEALKSGPIILDGFIQYMNDLKKEKDF